MPDFIKSLKKGTALIRTTVRDGSDSLARRTERAMSRNEEMLTSGMLFLMRQMSHFIERSFDLLESQLEESRLQQDVLRMEKELLRKQLAQQDADATDD